MEELEDKTNTITFWRRLNDFTKNVQVISENDIKERNMIIDQCRIKFHDFKKQIEKLRNEKI